MQIFTRPHLLISIVSEYTYDDPITMLDLMNHQAGFQETVYSIAVYDDGRIPPLGDALRSIRPQQVYRPGEFTGYSNWGAALAGYVVECVRNCYKIICTFWLVFHDSYCVEKTCRAPARLRFFAL